SETFRAASAACRATSEMAVALSRTSRSEPPILSSRALKARAVCPASSCRWIFTRAVKSLLPSMRTIARRMPSREPTMLRITRKDISASQEGHQRQDDEGHGEDRADDADGRELRRFSGFALFARPTVTEFEQFVQCHAGRLQVAYRGIVVAAQRVYRAGHGRP